MPNTILTPSVIAPRALATLYNNTILANLVTRDYESNFTGKQGDTITVRTPAQFTAKNFVRSTGIELQDITEGSFEVKLDRLLDVSFPVTSEEMTLEIDQFGERFLTPAMEAFAQEIDGTLAELLVDTAEGAGGGGTATVTSSKPRSVLRTARARLGRENIPTNDRYFVLSPEGNAAFTGDDVVENAAYSGSTDALREGFIQRAYGFDGFESPVFGFGAGDRGQADGVAFQRSAVSLVTRTLAKPMGVAAENCAVVNYKGFGLRVVYGYDQKYKQDVVSVDLLIGTKAIRPKAAVQLDLGQGS